MTPELFDAIAAEREACARLCDRYGAQDPDWTHAEELVTARRLAEAIRARGAAPLCEWCGCVPQMIVSALVGAAVWALAIAGVS